MKQDKPNSLRISIQGSFNTISIRKNVVRTLGSPEYIRLLINKKKNSIALRECRSNDPLSFRVPDGFAENVDRRFRITSKGFVGDLLRTNRLDTAGAYIIDGEYLEKENAVVFQMSEARPFEDE